MTDKLDAPFPLKYGCYEDARKLLGKAGKRVVAEFTVNWEMIKIYCSMVEDGNSSYWDEAYASEQWGGIIAPPGLLITWVMSLQWHPHKESEHCFVAVKIPLPGDTLINVATNTEFHKHLYLGDRLTLEDQLVELSEEKHTRLGIGHFLTTKARFYNQKQELVAVQTNSLFRYCVAQEK